MGICSACQGVRDERRRCRTCENLRRDKVKARAYSAKWSKANPEKEKAKNSKWVAENRERVRRHKAKWRAANRDAINALRQKRRAQKSGSAGSLSKGIERRLFGLQRGLCPCCQMPLGDSYHLDHILPLALGGLNVDANVQLLRATCNLHKHAKHPVDYMQSKGFLL